jgi:hypothetical protein
MHRRVAGLIAQFVLRAEVREALARGGGDHLLWNAIGCRLDHEPAHFHFA